MADKKDVLALLRAFSLRRKSQVIGFSDFVTFSQRYSEQKKAEIPSLGTLTSDTDIQLATHLEDLVEALHRVFELELLGGLRHRLLLSAGPRRNQAVAPVSNR